MENPGFAIAFRDADGIHVGLWALLLPRVRLWVIGGRGMIFQTLCITCDFAKEKTEFVCEELQHFQSNVIYLFIYLL